MPKNWKTYSLGELSKSISYGYTESASKEKIGPKFLRITDIQNDFIDWNNVPYCPLNENDGKKYALDLGDIDLTGVGLEPLSKLTKLVSLNLIWTNLTGVDLEPLSKLTNLKELHKRAIRQTRRMAL